MCGIFGVIAREEKYNKKELIKILEDLAKFSQVRGKDSSGLAYRFESTQTVKVLKGPFSIENLLKSSEYRLFKNEIENEKLTPNKLFVSFGHARLVTNGTQLEENNNQPVIKDGFIGIHNGIIANVEELWKEYSYLTRNYEIDTEFLLSYLRFKLESSERITLYQAFLEANNLIKGTISVGILDTYANKFLLFSNFGSLYVLTDFKELLIFASEKNILQNLLNENKILDEDNFRIIQVKPLEYYEIDLINFFICNQNEITKTNFYSQDNNPYKIKIENLKPLDNQIHVVIDPNNFKDINITNSDRKLLEYNIDRISKLRRCTKCILPETFPFIEFDSEGVCNYCRNYKPKNQPKPLSELEKLVEPYRKKNGEVDCLIPYSGGRDSTFTLHFVKKVLKLNPIAFTYDWGMVTDLARRNIARVCGKLGVENIIVAADIHWKRKNINKNISAWLKKPHLGMVPLFMAGDKYFYYYTHQVKKQNNIRLNIWGINPLENTDFKTGFAGIPPNFNKQRIFSLRLSDQLKLFAFVSKNVISSPGYVNQSVFDSVGSIFSRYLNPKSDYYHLFDYYKWDESEIENLIINEYEWELAVDTKTTWRIGDGTASFYNYIYYTVAGFSEYDTFRSNQIREGALSREKALQIVNEENKPRYETMKWYLEIVGLDFEPVIKKINNIPKLYI